MVPHPQRGPFRGLPREVPILTAISFTVALGFGIVAPDIPAFARHFGVSTAAAASVVSAFALMRIIGALPAGRLADRFGQPAVMATGIAIVAVSSIVAGFSNSFAELIILRGTGGLGSAMFGVSGQTLLLVSVPNEQRGRASGLFAGGFLLGGISGPAVGGVIAAWSERAPFIIYGCMLIVPAVIAGAVLHDRSRQRPETTHRPRRAAAEIAGALRDRAYRAAAAANLGDGFAVIGVRSAIVPLFVRDVLHRSAVWTGVGFLVVAAAQRRHAPSCRAPRRPVRPAPGDRGRMLHLRECPGPAGAVARARRVSHRAGRTRASDPGSSMSGLPPCSATSSRARAARLSPPTRWPVISVPLPGR